MVAGRQRDFDLNEALEAAMLVFWEKGFLGASLTDLTASMGINKPSMYAAFGNKEDLFVHAASHYIETVASPLLELLADEDKPLKQRLKDYLEALANLVCESKTPSGCFINVASNEVCADSLPKKAEKVVLDANNFFEKYLIDFLKAEQNAGRINNDADTKQLTLFLLTLIRGQAVMARNGKSKKQLYQVIDYAMPVIDQFFM